MPGEIGTSVRPKTEWQGVPEHMFQNKRGIMGYVEKARHGNWNKENEEVEGESPLSVEGTRDLLFPMIAVGVPEGPDDVCVDFSSEQLKNFFPRTDAWGYCQNYQMS